MSARPTLSSLRKASSPWESYFPSWRHQGRPPATLPRLHTLQGRQVVGTTRWWSSTSRNEIEEVLCLTLPFPPTRRHVTPRPLPRWIAARTCAGSVVRASNQFTRACSCFRNNICSRRTGTTATRWRIAPECAISPGSRLRRPVLHVKASRINRVMAHISPHEAAGTAVTSSIIVIVVQCAWQAANTVRRSNKKKKNSNRNNH